MYYGLGKKGARKYERYKYMFQALTFKQDKARGTERPQSVRELVRGVDDCDIDIETEVKI
jgi:hypothetical protein